MADLDYTEQNYWDYVSTLDVVEPRGTIRELVKDAYPLFLTFLEELFFIEANLIFLNIVHEIPQQEIASVIMRGGISQMGVSKRVNSGMKKIKTLVKRPEIDRNIIREDLKLLLPFQYREVVQLYYFYKTYAFVSELTGLSTSGVRNRVGEAVKILEAEKELTEETLPAFNFKNQMNIEKDKLPAVTRFAERYYDYLKILQSTYNSGDYLFNGQLNIDESLNNG